MPNGCDLWKIVFSSTFSTLRFKTIDNDPYFYIYLKRQVITFEKKFKPV